ncbi:MAG: hypothetical protein HFJ65_01935 [Eggerthellaceae bacterium]|nr:hypothetical protein [Eggerthellaceae bacterium]
MASDNEISIEDLLSAVSGNSRSQASTPSSTPSSRRRQEASDTTEDDLLLALGLPRFDSAPKAAPQDEPVQQKAQPEDQQAPEPEEASYPDQVHADTAKDRAKLWRQELSQADAHVAASGAEAAQQPQIQEEKPFQTDISALPHLTGGSIQPFGSPEKAKIGTLEGGPAGSGSKESVQGILKSVEQQLAESQPASAPVQASEPQPGAQPFAPFGQQAQTQPLPDQMQSEKQAQQPSPANASQAYPAQGMPMQGAKPQQPNPWMVPGQPHPAQPYPQQPLSQQPSEQQPHPQMQQMHPRFQPHPEAGAQPQPGAQQGMQPGMQPGAQPGMQPQPMAQMQPNMAAQPSFEVKPEEKPASQADIAAQAPDAASQEVASFKAEAASDEVIQAVDVTKMPEGQQRTEPQPAIEPHAQEREEERPDQIPQPQMLQPMMPPMQPPVQQPFQPQVIQPAEEEPEEGGGTSKAAQVVGAVLIGIAVICVAFAICLLTGVFDLSAMNPSAQSPAASQVSGQSSPSATQGSASQSDSNADAPSEGASQVVYSYVVRGTDGGTHEAIETASFNADGKLDSSTLEITADSQEDADALLEQLRQEFGDSMTAGSATPEKVTCTIKLSRDDLDQASYTELLSTNASEFKIVSQ